MRIATSLVANLLGQGWTALLNLAAVPFYIAALGVDAFGLIGLYTVVLTVVTLLDAGMATTLNREMVRHLAGERSREETLDLLRSVEVALGGAGLVLGVAALGLGPLLARVWIAPSTVPVATVSFSLTLMILASILRIFEAIYRAALLGLHRPVTMNALSVLLTTLRIAGVFGAFAVAGTDLHTFFAWQLIVGVVALAAFAVAVRLAIGRATRRPRFRAALLHGIRGFAGSAFAVAALGVALTQLDKIVVAAVVPLREVGYYAAATVLATGIYQVVLPVFHSVYPRLSLLHAQAEREGGNGEGFAAAYLSSAGLLAAVAAPPIAVLACFGRPVLLAWTGNPEVAAAAAPLLALLAPGALAYGLYHLPLAGLLAAGTQGVAVRALGVATALLVPASLVGFELARLAGVAAAWSATALLALALALTGTRRALFPALSPARLLDASLRPVLVAFAVAVLALPVPLPAGRFMLAATIGLIAAAVLAVTAAAAWRARA